MKSKFIFFLMACSVAVWAQDKTDEAAYEAYISQSSTPASWESFVKTRQVESTKTPQDSELLYKLALVQYGLLGSTMRKRDEKMFDKYYDQTVSTLKKIIDKKKDWAEPKALLSATYGLKMGYSPFMGMFLGSKSDQLTQDAIKLNPQSALAWKVNGMAKYHTPEMWGGDIKQAITALEKSIKLYELKPELLQFNWMYLDAMAFLGQAYKKNGESQKAIAIYEKALSIEPNFGWIKNSLLPAARAKE